MEIFNAFLPIFITNGENRKVLQERKKEYEQLSAHNKVVRLIKNQPQRSHKGLFRH